MKKQRKNSEKLSEYLGQVDVSLWEEAYLTDNAEKFRQLGAKNKPKHFATCIPAFRRTMAACLCVLLITSVITLLPRLSKFTPSDIYETEGTTMTTESDGEMQPSYISPETDPPVDQPSAIKSMDMFNYYSAVRQLFGGEAGKSVSGTGARKDESAAVGFPLELAASIYAINPHQVFYYTGTIFFQAELKDPDGFLANQIGTGVIDVVIIFYEDPGNAIDPMITFKNGDRYFSCMRNGAHYSKEYTEIDFSTHKYMEGFNVIKSSDRTNYMYTVTYDEASVLSVACEYFDVVGGTSFDSDKFTVIPGSSAISSASGSITLAELEQYYNQLHDEHKVLSHSNDIPS